MSALFPLSLLVLSSVVAAAPPASVGSPRTVDTDTEIPPASAVLPFIAKTPRSSAKKNLRESLGLRNTGGPFLATLGGSGGDSEYLVNITIGGQHYPVILDTGSSDLWVVEKGFECFNLTSYPEKPSECAFGSKGFDPKKSHTFEAYKDHNFNISYGDGEFLTGSVGFETVNIGGLQVSHQEFGLVNKAAWEGDGINSGLLGLAEPSLTSVYKGTNPDKDKVDQYEPYDPFFYTAVKDKKVTHPYFSIVLNRGTLKSEESTAYHPNLGHVAFGGYAPAATVSPTVTVPWISNDFNRGDLYYYYTIQVDSYTFPGSSHLDTFSNSTILDSGTTLNYVPTDVAAKYNAEFNPPAKNSDKYGGYVVVCTAKVPEFKVTIGGKTFSIDGRDQLLALGEKDSKGRELCYSGTQDGGALTGGNIFILGDVFLHNVVATFDISKHHVTLSQRKAY